MVGTDVIRVGMLYDTTAVEEVGDFAVLDSSVDSRFDDDRNRPSIAQTFGEIGWKRKLVRLPERDADRLMPWLLANAGYDPAEAVRFMRIWGPKHGGWIFRARTHDGWDERLEFIAAELPKIEQAQSLRDDGLADWAQYFDAELKIEFDPGRRSPGMIGFALDRQSSSDKASGRSSHGMGTGTGVIASTTGRTSHLRRTDRE